METLLSIQQRNGPGSGVANAKRAGSELPAPIGQRIAPPSVDGSNIDLSFELTQRHRLLRWVPKRGHQSVTP